LGGEVGDELAPGVLRVEAAVIGGGRVVGREVFVEA
jgi:hypothetical protein